jgi:hypothetical protein
LRIISLSSIPPRFATLGPTLESLVKQRGTVDEIRLYIPKHYRRFPNYDGAPPEVPSGVTVVRPEDDLGPASKVLFAAKTFQGRDAQILFCDDDKIFGPTWASDLFTAQASRPNECVALIGKILSANLGKSTLLEPKAIRARKNSLALRVRRLQHKLTSILSGAQHVRPMGAAIAKAGYADILQGVGGVVVKPEFFDDVAHDIPEVVWAVDDVWLSGMLSRKGIPIWLPAGIAMPETTDAHDVESLYRATIEGATRREANRRCIAYMQQHFKVWL